MTTNQDRAAVQDHPTAAIHRMIAARKKPAADKTTEQHPSRPCGAFHPDIDDPHAAAYCNLQENHGGPHYSVLKGKQWEEE